MYEEFILEHNKERGIKDLIKYFEVVYEISDIIKIDSRISTSLIKHKSFSSSKMLNLFFEIVLDYYHKKTNVPIDYTSTESDKVKLKVIQNIFDLGYPDLFKKLFDLADFMFKTIKKILIKINEGYDKWKRIVDISLSSTIYPNLDILFYITFYPVFPEELRDVLHKELRLDKTEYQIIKRCNSQILRQNSNVCNYNNENFKIEIGDFSKFDFISDEQKTFLQNLKNASPIKSKFHDNLPEYPLNTQIGVMTLFNIILKLRHFGKRRRSRLDSI